ncbi:hypothetical protein ACW5XW_23960 [Aeromonas piscicola]
MNDKIKEVLEQGSNIGGWVKTGTLIGAGIVACVLIWNQVGTNTADIEKLNRFQSNHYGLIQGLDKNQIKIDGRVNVLESDSKRQDELNSKMMETLNTLNISIERLNTTIDLLQRSNK